MWEQLAIFKVYFDSDYLPVFLERTKISMHIHRL